jgi:hypothetical protein
MQAVVRYHIRSMFAGFSPRHVRTALSDVPSIMPELLAVAGSLQAVADAVFDRASVRLYDMPYRRRPVQVRKGAWEDVARARLTRHSIEHEGTLRSSVHFSNVYIVSSANVSGPGRLRTACFATVCRSSRTTFHTHRLSFPSTKRPLSSVFRRLVALSIVGPFCCSVQCSRLHCFLMAEPKAR